MHPNDSYPYLKHIVLEDRFYKKSILRVAICNYCFNRTDIEPLAGVLKLRMIVAFEPGMCCVEGCRSNLHWSFLLKPMTSIEYLTNLENKENLYWNYINNVYTKEGVKLCPTSVTNSRI